MYGRLYYNLPRSDAPTGNGYVCVDLQTGEQIYWQNMTMPTIGQFYDYESMNQHGVIENGYLWSTSGTTWSAYDPFDGNWLFNLTGVPSGTQVYGPNGEILIYRLDNTNHWIAQWNNTGAPNLALRPGTGTDAYQWRPVGKVVNASTAYDWNITIPTLPTGARIVRVLYNDLILGTSSTFAATTSYGTPDPWTMWAISLKPESRGQILWQKSYPAPPGNASLVQGPVDLESRVFAMYEKETMRFSGFSLDNGNQLWGPSEPMQSSYDFYNYLTNYGLDAAYGNLYTCSYGGVLYCYNMTTGKLSWTYGNGGEGNSTNSGIDTPWGNYPLMLAAIADGKVYVYTSEHSPNVPPYKGSRVRCIDAYTGEEVWTVLGWGSVGTGNSGSFAVADGYLVYLNTYDMQVYCIGKGPSATTVQAPLSGVTVGQSIIIQGTVIDTSAGAKAKVARGQFTSVPAMSDVSQGKWMEYVYMQKPMPSDAVGVDVIIFATDASGHSEQIATVTSGSSGLYSYEWVPQNPGKYVITAVFEGSESYWGSSAETAVSVNAVSGLITPTPTSTPPP
jgi:outer membrane protein assembly factor BamB